MTKHILALSSKGGVGKSTTVNYIARVFGNEGIEFATANLDSQDHFSDIDNENAEYVIYDTAGVLSAHTNTLLNNLQGHEYVILVPVGTGLLDIMEVPFIANKLEKLGLLENTHFFFNKVRGNTKRLREAREAFVVQNLNVAKANISLLEEIASLSTTRRAMNEFSRLVHEVIL